MSEANVRLLGLRALVGWMSLRRKRQLVVLFALMLAGAIAELASIGAVIPFLRLVVAPDALLSDPRIAPIATAQGWRVPGDLVLPAAVLLIGCTILTAGMRLLLAWAGQRFIYRLGYDMDAALFRRTVNQPYLAHVERSGSAMLAGFDKINVLTNTLLLPVMTGIASVVIAMGIVALLVAIDPLAAAATTLTAGVTYAGIAFLSRRSLRIISHERAQLATARVGAVQEGLGALRDIIIDRSQAVHERRFAKINDRFRDMGARAAIIAITPRFVVEATGVTLIGLLAVWLAGRPGGILAAVPVLGALVLGAQRLLPLLQASYYALIQYLAARRALADVLDLMTSPMLPLPAPADSTMPPPFRHEIAMVDLGFRYSTGAAALRGIDLVITRGERIGLIGRTGSGKTTLADVTMGLLHPSEGMLLLDGVPLSSDRTARWQAQIAHVPQAVFLADDTIAANIAFGAEEHAIDLSRIEEAARRAQFHDIVTDLPDGYATKVGERGIRLSGGQRQRIGIARALYKRADILVLDEATSALDDVTEAAVMAAIDEVGHNLTMIIIAHRLSTLRGCTTICRLEGGRIIAQGDYATIIGDPGERA